MVCKLCRRNSLGNYYIILDMLKEFIFFVKKKIFYLNNLEIGLNHCKMSQGRYISFKAISYSYNFNPQRMKYSTYSLYKLHILVGRLSEDQYYSINYLIAYVSSQAMMRDQSRIQEGTCSLVIYVNNFDLDFRYMIGMTYYLCRLNKCLKNMADSLFDWGSCRRSLKKGSCTIYLKVLNCLSFELLCTKDSWLNLSNFRILIDMLHMHNGKIYSEFIIIKLPMQSSCKVRLE